jgi:hypothetical protein
VRKSRDIFEVNANRGRRPRHVLLDQFGELLGGGQQFRVLARANQSPLGAFVLEPAALLTSLHARRWPAPGAVDGLEAALTRLMALNQGAGVVSAHGPSAGFGAVC